MSVVNALLLEAAETSGKALLAHGDSDLAVTVHGTTSVATETAGSTDRSVGLKVAVTEANLTAVADLLGVGAESSVQAGVDTDLATNARAVVVGKVLLTEANASAETRARSADLAVVADATTAVGTSEAELAINAASKATAKSVDELSLISELVESVGADVGTNVAPEGRAVAKIGSAAKVEVIVALVGRLRGEKTVIVVDDALGHDLLDVLLGLHIVACGDEAGHEGSNGESVLHSFYASLLFFV